MPTLVSECARIERELWTDEDFLAWLQPGVHADLISGEKAMHSPVSLRHARCLNAIDLRIRQWMATGGGGELFREVVAVRLSTRNVFLPDLAWFTDEQVPMLLPSHAPLAPKWVCEALSPRTADRDIGLKFAAYEEHGVDEYWIVDPETGAHRFYAREGELLVEFPPDTDGRVHSRVMAGFHMRMAELDAAAAGGV
jgi:Uma2 family endonuclease